MSDLRAGIKILKMIYDFLDLFTAECQCFGANSSTAAFPRLLRCDLASSDYFHKHERER